MIIVALIGLLATLLIPAFIRARKRSQASRIISDARMIDMAVDGWAVEFNKQDGDDVVLSEAAQYTKSGTIPTTDVLSNPYQIGPVGPTQVLVSVTSKTALNTTGVDWAPY